MKIPLRVLVALPDAPTRVGIRLVLEGDGFVVCGEPLAAADAIAVAVREAPHVCLVDEDLPGGAIAAIDGIAHHLPETKVVVLTASEDPPTLFAAVEAGASGYVRKDLDPLRLGATLRGVLAGEAAFSRQLTARLVERLRTRERGRSAPTRAGGPAMTDRELEVLELLADGLRTSEVAGRLAITETTVRRHVSSAVGKLGVADRAAAVDVLRRSSA